MPKAAVDEDRDLSAHERDVGLNTHTVENDRPVDPVPKPFCVEQPANRALWSRVTTTVGSHIPALRRGRGGFIDTVFAHDAGRPLERDLITEARAGRLQSGA